MKSYSVLMSVYQKDCPDHFRAAFESVISQTQSPKQFVLVKDGPVSESLEDEIRRLGQLCISREIGFVLCSLDKNSGLGPALNKGLPLCSEELVARMDADDIALPQRCAKQTAFMERHPEIMVLSGTIIEFEGTPPDPLSVPGSLVRKYVPETDAAIRRFASSRNPVNHPCVMYRKKAVLEAGGYRSIPLFEDYDLWLRMMKQSENGRTGKFANLPEELLLMRTDGMYQRRGGLRYAQNILRFRNEMYRDGYLSLPKHLVTTAARVAVSLLPGSIRKFIYRRLLR